MLTLKPLAVTSLVLGVGLALGGCAASTESEPTDTNSAALVEDKQQVGQEEMIPGQEQGQQYPQDPQDPQGPIQAEMGQPGQAGEPQNVLTDPETGETVLDPDTGEPIQVDPETGEPLGSAGGPAGEQTGEAPAAATFFRGGGWGWGRPGWGGGWRGGWGRPGWGGAWRGGGWGYRPWGWGGHRGWGWRGGWW